MPVDRPDIVEAEFFKQRSAGHHAARIFLRACRLVVHEARQMPRKLLADLAQRQIGAARNQAREIGRHRPDRRSDRHLVVVQDHDQARIHRAGIVHGLIGHAGGHRAVADHRNDIVLQTGKIARHRHSQAGGNRSRRMRRAETVVLTLGTFGETRKTATLPQGANAVAPPGEDLVRIGLMSDVPDQPVLRGVENGMERHRQFDHAEAGAQDALRSRRPR